VVFLITSGQLCYDVISCLRSVSEYSEIPCSIRIVEDGYGDARLLWFSLLLPDGFVTTSLTGLDVFLQHVLMYPVRLINLPLDSSA